MGLENQIDAQCAGKLSCPQSLFAAILVAADIAEVTGDSSSLQRELLELSERGVHLGRA